jgi:hypothetical protein
MVVMTNRKFIGICPFYAISNTFICIATINPSGKVSAAGDVNGDGLDDLIVGAHKADSNSNKLDSGKSYVIFGKIDSTTKYWVCVIYDNTQSIFTYI